MQTSAPELKTPVLKILVSEEWILPVESEVAWIKAMADNRDPDFVFGVLQHYVERMTKELAAARRALLSRRTRGVTRYQVYSDVFVLRLRFGMIEERWKEIEHIFPKVSLGLELSRIKEHLEPFEKRLVVTNKGLRYLAAKKKKKKK